VKKNNIFFLIEARISSTRLPGKVLKKVYKNHCVIDYVIKNILKAGISKENIILAIPKNKKNNKISSYVKKKYFIKIFKGSEENVFERIHECCRKYNIKNFVRITADNIFIDPIFLKKFIKFSKSSNADYVASRTMAHSPNWKLKSDYNEGSSVEILKFKLLEKVKKLVNKKNYEYPTWHIFSQPKKFKLKKFKLIKEYQRLKIKRFRTTLDTKADLDFLRIVSRKLRLIPGQNNLLKILKNNKMDSYSKINEKSEKKLAYKVIKQKNK